MPVLVVEDDAATRDSGDAHARRAGHHRNRNSERWRIGDRGTKKRAYSTLILDLMMPKVDGYEVLRALRDGTSKRPDRVIVMTAHTQPAELDGIVAPGAATCSCPSRSA